ncbi:MAG: transcription antitermination factor NusB [Tepidisphaeraceae bacterium]|jgi:16S rRNA (cytosine967-C5)-methyltransferase
MNARDWALLELDRRRLPGWPEHCLHAGHHRPPADPRDRGLSEQITIGVIKNLFLLEHQLAHFSGQEVEHVEPLVKKIMVIGLYQLGFLEGIPPAPAVNEAVNQAKRFGRPRAAGFVNAVLRNATRQPPAPLPDAASEPREYARVALSHPLELFDKLSGLLGPERALDFCRHDNAQPPTLLRLFPGADLPALSGPSITVTPHERPGIFVVEGAMRADFARWAEEGIGQVQDASSARVVDYLDVRPGHRVMDRCAGLGTKTIQMAERLEGSGELFAVDPAEYRCRALRNLIERRQLNNIQVFQTPRTSDLPPGEFDRILVDVPCSNSGVLSRRPEARYNQDAKAIQSLVQLQERILEDTLPRLANGGTMIYSTCSIWPEENHDLIARLVDRHPEIEMTQCEAMLPVLPTPAPTAYHDGGFFAVLRHKGKSQAAV